MKFNGPYPNAVREAIKRALDIHPALKPYRHSENPKAKTKRWQLPNRRFVALEVYQATIQPIWVSADGLPALPLPHIQQEPYRPGEPRHSNLPGELRDGAAIKFLPQSVHEALEIVKLAATAS